MIKKLVKILAIETSCDETAAAVIGEEDGKPAILSNIISSQIDLHAKTGGVVPEVASRAHMEAIVPVIAEALLGSVIGGRSSTLRKEPSGSDSNEWSVAEATNHRLQTTDYAEAMRLLQDITHIAVTAGPGLIGSLLVGFNAAKTMAYALDLPIVPINHIEGHIYSALGGIDSSKAPLFAEASRGRQVARHKDSGEDSSLLATRYSFPLLALTVSGGHTSLTLMKDHGEYELIGETVDDAVGEAYDKVAKLLGLGYPGGPAISKMASHFRDSSSKAPLFAGASRGRQVARDKDSDEDSSLLATRYLTLDIQFPRPMIESGDFNFSFSGLKTAVLIWVKKYLAQTGIEDPGDIPLEIKEEIAAAFEEAVKDVLVAKTERAVKKYKPKAVVFAGGVSANRYLASQIGSAVSGLGSVKTTNHQPLATNFFVPDKDLTGDNAAMIGLAAYHHIRRGDAKQWNDISVNSNLKL